MGGEKKRAWYRLLAHAYNYLKFLSFVMSSIVDRNHYVMIVLVVGLALISLVPRPFRGGKGPGVYCLCMRQNFRYITRKIIVYNTQTRV